MALFAKIVRKISKRLIDVQKAAINDQLPKSNAVSVRPAKETGAVSGLIEQELDEAGSDALKALQARQKEMLDSLDLRK